ncbi:MAG: hypothetical protein MAG451_00182 [Anaerolineales bacterium]|nr:hypothetical protein [Anaerolineales bacterium]
MKNARRIILLLALIAIFIILAQRLDQFSAPPATPTPTERAVQQPQEEPVTATHTPEGYPSPPTATPEGPYPPPKPTPTLTPEGYQPPPG